MARLFSGQTITAPAGAFSGVPFTYGTMAFIVRFSNITGWQEWYSNTLTSGVLYCGIDTSSALAVSYDGTNNSLATTTKPTLNTWHCIIIHKATGSSVPQFNLYNYSTGFWTSQAGDIAIADSAVNMGNHSLGSYQGSFDFFSGDVAAMGLFRTLVPASNPAAQELGLHLSRLAWLKAAAAADRAAVWFFDQSATTMPLLDLTGGGANQSASTTPAISTNSVPLLSYGAPIFRGAVTAEVFLPSAPQPPPEFVQALATGVATASAGSTTFSFSGPTYPQAGDTVFVFCSRDDAASEATTPTGDTFSDGIAGNVYTKVAATGSGHTDATGANGIVGIMFFCRLNVAWSGTVSGIWTHPTVTARAMRADHWRYLSSVRPNSAGIGGSTAGAPTATTGATTPNVGDVVIGMAAIEHSSASTITADSDTTNGSWSTLAQIANGGTTLAAVKVASQYKIVTASGAQTYNVTNSVTASVDAVSIVAAFAPISANTTRYIYTPALQHAASW